MTIDNYILHQNKGVYNIAEKWHSVHGNVRLMAVPLVEWMDRFIEKI